LHPQKFLPSNPEELFEERGIPRIRFEYGHDNVARDRHEAGQSRDSIIKKHAAHEPIWELSLPCLADDEKIIERDISDVTGARDNADDEGLAKSHTTNRETFV